MSLEWVCIDANGVISREPDPRPDCVVVILWQVWDQLPPEHRNTLIWKAKSARVVES